MGVIGIANPSASEIFFCRIGFEYPFHFARFASHGLLKHHWVRLGVAFRGRLGKAKFELALYRSRSTDTAGEHDDRNSRVLNLVALTFVRAVR